MTTVWSCTNQHNMFFIIIRLNYYNLNVSSCRWFLSLVGIGQSEHSYHVINSPRIVYIEILLHVYAVVTMLSVHESLMSLTLRLAIPTLYNFRANFLLDLCNPSCIWSDINMTDHECAILVVLSHGLFPATYIIN